MRRAKLPHPINDGTEAGWRHSSSRPFYEESLRQLIRLVAVQRKRILLQPWSLFVIAVVAFLVFLTIGKMSKHP